MPVVTIRVAATAENQKGESIQVPPSEALANLGPVLEATLTASDAQQKALASKGEQAKSRTGVVMFDTGASSTCFDQSVAEEVGLPTIGRGLVTSATHEEIQVPTYTGKLIIPSLSINIENAMGVNLNSQGIIALIGRDVLKHGIFFYSGVDGSVSFAI